MSTYQLAQMNVATLKTSLDSPDMADFVARLAPINALAEQSDGFVWRLQDDAGDATNYRPLGDKVLVNMSVWRDVESLSSYAFKSAHVEIMRRRREWFERMETAYSVLWWMPPGHRPTVEEGIARLEHLRASGCSQRAFTFKEPFPAPDARDASVPAPFGGACPAT